MRALALLGLGIATIAAACASERIVYLGGGGCPTTTSPSATGGAGTGGHGGAAGTGGSVGDAGEEADAPLDAQHMDSGEGGEVDGQADGPDAAPCGAAGADCNSGADCCGGSCDFSKFTCE